MANVKIVPMAMTPEEDSVQAYKNKLALAQALMNQDMPNAVYSPGTGALLAGSKMLGGFLAGQADRKEKQDEEDAWNPLKAMVDASVAGFNTGGGSAPSMAGGDGNDIPTFNMPSSGGGYNPSGKMPTFAGGENVGATDLLKQFEGFRSKPYWDVNAFRAGFGSDTITDPATGQVRKVTKNDVVTPEMAMADLQRRIPEFQGTIAKQVPTFAQLPQNVQAGLTSMAYNYGSLPKSVAVAAASGDPRAIAQAVAARAGDNGGVNARRRQTEAAIIASGAGGAPQAEIAGGAGQNVAAGGDNLTAPIPVTRLPAVQPPDFSGPQQKMILGQRMLGNPRTRAAGFQLWQQGMSEMSALRSQYLTAQREMAVKQAELGLKEREFGATEADRQRNFGLNTQKFQSEDADRTGRLALDTQKFDWEKKKPVMAGRDQRVITIDPATGQPSVAIEAAPPLPPAEAQAAEYYQQHPDAFNTAKELRAAGRASMSQSVGGGSDNKIFDALKEQYDKASPAVTGLKSLAEAKAAIDAGGIFGQGADFRLGLSKLGALMGINSPDEAINTETFRSAIAPQISAMMKATVGSTQISNTDREFAEKAAGGAITLEPGSIKRLINIMDKAGRVAIQMHNEKVDAVYPDGKGFDRERALFRLPEPPPMPAAPKAQAPQAQGREWQNPDQTQTPPPPPVGTIMDGHRFKGGNPADEKNWEKLR